MCLRIPLLATVEEAVYRLLKRRASFSLEASPVQPVNTVGAVHARRAFGRLERAALLLSLTTGFSLAATQALPQHRTMLNLQLVEAKTASDVKVCFYVMFICHFKFFNS